MTAIDTEIMGGYGRSPGSGELVRGTPFLGLFKNCTLELVELRSLQELDGGQVHFDGCRFRLKEADPRGWTGESSTFSACTYERIPRDSEGLQKDLADLFPGVR